jgi:hypothetical protein
MFGCDFFPSLNNIKLYDVNIKLLINSEQFVYYNDDHKIALNQDAMYNFILLLENDLDEDMIEINSTSSSDSSKSSISRKPFNNLKLTTYSNISTFNIEIENIDCGGECMLCNPSKFCTVAELEQATYQYINMLIWTINYFTGTLDVVKVNNTNNKRVDKWDKSKKVVR